LLEETRLQIEQTVKAACCSFRNQLQENVMARSKVVSTTLTALEEQLRTDGFKGTQRAMRLLKSLRDALTGDGYSFGTETKREVTATTTTGKKRGRPRKVVAAITTTTTGKKRGRPRKEHPSVDEALAALTASTPVETPSLDATDTESPAF
jgi:hypothetical protein